jgi:hypothetical protein
MMNATMGTVRNADYAIAVAGGKYSNNCGLCVTVWSLAFKLPEVCSFHAVGLCTVHGVSRKLWRCDRQRKCTEMYDYESHCRKSSGTFCNDIPIELKYLATGLHRITVCLKLAVYSIGRPRTAQYDAYCLLTCIAT